MKEIFNKAVLILALSMALIIETRAENMPSPGMKDDKEQPVQTIRGTVVDAVTGQPLTGATIMIEESAGVGASADENGQFEIKNLRVGRYTLKVNYIGYEPVVMKEQLVISGKETVVSITMNEDVKSMNEVVVKVSKQKPLCQTASVGARMFSMEEINRTPGGVEDPARLASSFAGVSQGGATNGISVHGNAPHLLAWRIEGVEVPNPNHYADISVSGAGIFSSLSTKVMGNSDFFTSAFPSEYSNAVSGVFDMKMRSGNQQRHEHTFQAGVLGFDLASEGPLGRNKKASYVVNYRYSFLGLATDMGMIDLDGQKMKYQDLNFKINMPTRNAGVFSLWGTGLIDDYKDPEKKFADWESTADARCTIGMQKMFATGITHRYAFRGDAQLKTSLAYTMSYADLSSDMFFRTDKDGNPVMEWNLPKEVGAMQSNRCYYADNTNSNLILTSAFNKRFSSHFINKTGFTLTGLFSDVKIDLSDYLTTPLKRIVDTRNSTMLLSLFTNNQLHYGAFTFNLGLAYQHLSLNGESSVEPRIGVEYDVNSRLKLAAGFGIHSRKEQTDVYFYEKDGKRENTDLGFTKARHFTLSVQYKMSDDMYIKVEPYYQSLYNIPVEPGTSFSMINNTFSIVDKCLNPDGKGRNYGVDITLEKYMSRGWFGMVTASLFSSRFRASDGNWYHSRYDRNYIINFVAGKEWL
ncbi:MAG: TonB-dependent receptor [Prevotella sp.]|nr:TonB-dependent receptor [Prevotella sp.]